MASNSNTILRQTIDTILASNSVAIQKDTKLRKHTGSKLPHTRDLELALTVLLVDLASCDQKFDQREYGAIVAGLRRMFGTDRFEVSALINQANLVLANLRGTSKFVELLRDGLDQHQKQQIMEIIDDAIMADAVRDDFEIYLRHKFAHMLGVQLPVPEQKS